MSAKTKLQDLVPVIENDCPALCAEVVYRHDTGQWPEPSRVKDMARRFSEETGAAFADSLSLVEGAIIDVAYDRYATAIAIMKESGSAATQSTRK
jgi:hypothetical protein